MVNDSWSDDPVVDYSGVLPPEEIIDYAEQIAWLTENCACPRHAFYRNRRDAYRALLEAAMSTEWTCTNCGATFKDVSALGQHNFIVHSKDAWTGPPNAPKPDLSGVMAEIEAEAVRQTKLQQSYDRLERDLRKKP